MHPISVVVASFRSRDDLRQCLQSLIPQCTRSGAELIVVRPPIDPPGTLGEITAGCRLVEAHPGDNIPRLRGRGMAVADGNWVAVAEDNCIADERWLTALISAAESDDADVLGGSMGNAQTSRAIDWAAFFSEYGYYAPNRPSTLPGGPPLVTGANVAYHRRIVSDVAQWAMNGDWENVIHGRLYGSGKRFRLVPEARLLQNLRYGLVEFCKDRFEHGRNYARTRSRDMKLPARLFFTAASAGLPFFRAAKLGAAADPAERGSFLRALPATMAFLAAWSAGEVAGYVRPRPPR
jgi:GT2 family glycosyltransferase